MNAWSDSAPTSLPPLPAAPQPGGSLQNQRLAVAAHLHVLLRRHQGRVIDATWAASNDDYARELVRLATQDPSRPELMLLGQRLQALIPAAPPRHAVPMPPPAAAPRYVRSLR